jgi:uncharacterized protein
LNGLNIEPGDKALVLGATGGIGQVFCHALAESGLSLIISGRDEAALQRLSQSIQAEFNSPIEIRCWDLTHEADIQAAIACLEADAKITWLVNSSGLAGWGRFDETEPVKLQNLLQVNLVAATRLIQAAVLVFKDRRRGNIIHVSSFAGYFPVPFLASYTATKSGMIQLITALHRELRSTPIRIQALCPGFVNTPMFAKAGADTKKLPSIVWISPERVVRESLSGVQQNRAIVIPGRRYRLLKWGSRWIPTVWQASLAGWLFGQFDRYKLSSND